MNIFVTVGTGKFDELVKQIDLIKQHKIIIQIGSGTYLPKNHNYYRIKKDIISDIKKADIIITHGGTGTIFECLNFNKKAIVVPNLDRTDKHQLEIVRKLEQKHYIYSCNNINKLETMIKNLPKLIKYQKGKSNIHNVIMNKF